MWTRWGTGNICCETVPWRGSGLLQLDPEGNGGDSSHLQEKLLRPLTLQMCNESKPSIHRNTLKKFKYQMVSDYF